MRGLSVDGEHPDELVSGGTPLAKRTYGAQLVRALARRKNRPDHVVMARLDRGFRNTVDCVQTVEAWQKRGIALHIVDMGGTAIDTAKAAGKFMLTVLAAAAEMERSFTSERTRAASRRLQANGRRVCGTRNLPYGYELDPDGPKITGRDGQARLANIRCVADEQATIGLIRTLHKEGRGLREIARILNSRGETCRGNQWRHSTISAILKREHRA